MSTQTIRALLIEDDLADQQLIERSIKRSHSPIELCCADRLADGLSHLSEGGFDVVLTDLSLPDSFGLETVQQIREHDLNIPIVILTTLDNREVELRSLAVGAQDYILKDEASPDSLTRAIHHAIQRQESIVKIQSLLTEVESSRKLLADKEHLLKKKNQRLRKLYKTAHRFVNNVSHEFRTPLTVIKDYVSLVREGMVGEVTDEQRRMLDIAGVRADDLNNMVDDLLDVSRLESGLLGAWRRPCQLAEVIESVCAPLARKAEVKEIAFSTAVDPALPEVYCDTEKVGRVIINLVTNAMKFCGDPGSVRLWARQIDSRDEVMIGITDNGQGMSDEGLQEIFERFKQLPSKIKCNTKGFGLGLNIAKELVELNFGDLSVESQIGQGTTFTFTVPVNSPVVVAERYLRKLQQSKSSLNVALIRVQIDENTTKADADDADTFFNYLLRRNDVLFRTGTTSWLFAMPIHQLEMETFISRAQIEWKKTNRNRPYGPIPAFTMNVHGSYTAGTESAVILEQFSSILQPAGEPRQPVPGLKLAFEPQHADVELVGNSTVST